MIRKIKYSQIDFTQYSNRIKSALQRNFYAKREILDVLCESWEILVYGDYDFVMPVPLKRKWGLQVVIMPLFCQQLGVFGNERNADIEQEFLNFFRENYRIFSYSFNHYNSFQPALSPKKNYIIQRTSFAELRKHYFKGRKSTVKTAQYLNFREMELKDVMLFLKNNFKGLDKTGDMARFFRYTTFLEEKKMLRLFGSFKKEQLTNLAVLIEEPSRLSLLALVNDPHFKNDNGASFLIDRILQENIAAKEFDFMGGNIRGIELFFKSFGSGLQEYPILESSKRDLVRNIFRK